MNVTRYAVALGAATVIGLSATLAGSAHATPAVNRPAALTANQIAAEALHDLTSATSVHFAVSAKEAGISVSAGITLTRTACDGTISAGKFGTFQFIQVGKTSWMLLTKQFLKQLGYSTAQIAAYSGKWVKNDPQASSDTSQLCGIRQFSHGFPVKGWTMGPVTTRSGHRVVEITSRKPKVTVYILDSARPEFVKFTAEGATATFSGFNARVRISPPPSKLVVNSLPTPPGLSGTHW